MLFEIAAAQLFKKGVQLPRQLFTGQMIKITPAKQCIVLKKELQSMIDAGATMPQGNMYPFFSSRFSNDIRSIIGAG